MNNLYIQSVLIDHESIDKNSYIEHIEPIKNLDCLNFSKRATFFVGENGSGKSTLLEAIAIAVGFNPEGGTKNYSFSTQDTHSELYDHIKVIRGAHRESWGYFLRAESFYNVASKEKEYNEILSKGYHLKSHGEAFLAVMQDNLRADSLYLLDEPEAALSPIRQLTLLFEIEQSVRDGAQFIIATHSPILLGLPDAEILSFDDGYIEQCEYEDTSSYQVYKSFIESRELVLRELFKSD